MDAIFQPVLVFGITGLTCGMVLAVAARFFAVREDPRVEQLVTLLPGANCGGCGYPGCLEYAKAMVMEGVPADLCKAVGKEAMQKICRCVGKDAVVREREVALVLCQGGDDVAVRKARYNGVADCAAAELAGGGPKACRFGCLGLGTCSRVCPVKAVEITGHNLAVVHPELCIGCGLCAQACPRKIIRLVPENRSIHVLCRSLDKGPAVKKVCSVGCIACTLCVKASGGQAIRMEGALAVVDYSKSLEDQQVIDRTKGRKWCATTDTTATNPAACARSTKRRKPALEKKP